MLSEQRRESNARKGREGGHMSKGGLPSSGKRNRHHRVMHSIPALVRIAHRRSAKDSDRRIGCCVVLPIFETWGNVPLSKRVDDTAERVRRSVLAEQFGWALASGRCGFLASRM